VEDPLLSIGNQIGAMNACGVEKRKASVRLKCSRCGCPGQSKSALCSAARDPLEADLGNGNVWQRILETNQLVLVGKPTGACRRFGSDKV
jgi:hypothetical protein